MGFCPRDICPQSCAFLHPLGAGVWAGLGRMEEEEMAVSATLLAGGVLPLRPREMLLEPSRVPQAQKLSRLS